VRPSPVVEPQEYIDALDEPRRADIAALHALIRRVAPDLKPVATDRGLGYGPFHYRYPTGREGDAALLGLVSNKRYISLHVLCATEGRYLAETFADRLPKASVGRSCVRFPRLAAVDPDVIEELVGRAAELGPGDAAGAAHAGRA
jgi:hypothetical protein